MFARSWQAPDGRVIVLRDEDLDHLPLATRKTIDILGFVGQEGTRGLRALLLKRLDGTPPKEGGTMGMIHLFRPHGRIW
ncbi:hypothetical protein [Actinacidiphila acididurans]|uniref:Uncharacterized protein n=1 Tax=Actinacidiphila acididurans TaxID=2784346 RepID=A0ABS2TKR8_9ACTN|nr:hypothetical protein [Actinacidiphila acididurans]MBM9503096.1 hypothetical protein [Actinacidiphila acididurans]